MFANAFKSLILILLILCLLALVYALALSPMVLSWGASPKEVEMQLPGDSLASFVSSTRAITISKPAKEVWPWLVQFGADRSGFFSYTFIERLMGYKGRDFIEIRPEFQNMPKGRTIPASMGPTSDLGISGWLVEDVKPGKYFVLKDWGTFWLEALDQNHSRLIVRTNGWPTPDFKSRLGYELMMPLHFIMEKRMLKGIKARAEAGPGRPLSQMNDYIWFGGLCLSGLVILWLVFASRGISSFILPMVYCLVLLGAMLILEPQHYYAGGLLAVALIHLIIVKARRTRRRIYI